MVTATHRAKAKSVAASACKAKIMAVRSCILPSDLLRQLRSTFMVQELDMLAAIQ